MFVHRVPFVEDFSSRCVEVAIAESTANHTVINIVVVSAECSEEDTFVVFA